jgi:kynurenine formamidase
VRRMVHVVAAGAILATLAWAQQAPERAAPRDLLAGIASGRTRVVDLSYALSDKLPAWPGSGHAFEATVEATYEKNGYFARSFRTLEHFGTHLDAPAHFVRGSASVDRIPAQRLIGPAVVIDVRDDARRDADYRLTPARVEQWEKQHGRIPAGAIVVLRTGWSARWPDAARYFNQDAHGTMHFPGYSLEAVKLLIARKVSGLGIDTGSIDYGPSKGFEVHQISLGAGLYHLENLAGLSALPESGAYLVAAPIKLEGGSGGPCRVLAIVPTLVAGTER